MRLWVRPRVHETCTDSVSRVAGAHRTPPWTRHSTHLHNPCSRQSVFRVKSGKQEQKTLSRTPAYLAGLAHVTIIYQLPGWRMLTPFPFNSWCNACMIRVNMFSRTGYPMSKSSSHGTLPYFSFQSCHMNIRYYHQDLQQMLFHQGSHQRICSQQSRPPTLCNIECVNGQASVARLSAIHFQG